MAALVLDGASLARRRLPMIAARAEAVRSVRGRSPSFVIVAFGDEQGRAANVAPKQRIGREVGVDVTPLIIGPDVQTGEALERMRGVLDAGSFDGVFVQFPFPDEIDGGVLASAVPVEMDVDIMTPVRTAGFMNGTDDLPPVTVSAALLLLQDYRVSIERRRGIVIANEDPFSLMLRASLALQGADMGPIVDPADPHLDERVSRAELLIVSAAMPGLVQSSAIMPGAVAIDVGYFNPGGEGDIDLGGGFEHLAAIAPVPGGIGPMTISALLERVVLFAEQSSTS